MGYNNKERCVKFLHSNPENRNWEDVKIIAFDAPQVTDKPYSERLALLNQSNLTIFTIDFLRYPCGPSYSIYSKARTVST
jgi:hypothetical protein